MISVAANYVCLNHYCAIPIKRHSPRQRSRTRITMSTSIASDQVNFIGWTSEDEYSSTASLSLTATTTVTPRSGTTRNIPLGLPGPMFIIIHVVACVCLSASVIVSLGLLVYLFKFSQPVKKCSASNENVNGVSPRQDGLKRPGDCPENISGNANHDHCADPRSTSRITAQSSKKTNPKQLIFWKWNIGERFVVYLAIDDLMFSVINLNTHAFMLFTDDFPVENLCKILAFFFQIFAIAQWFIIFGSAACACGLVVFNRKPRLGRWDWRMLVFAFGCPLMLSVVCAGLDILGPNGSWLVYTVIKYRILALCSRDALRLNIDTASRIVY